MTLTDDIQKLRDAGVDEKVLEAVGYLDDILDRGAEYDTIQPPTRTVTHTAIHALTEALIAANSWDGMMRVLDRHYPAEVFDGSSGDPGPTIVVLTRAIDDLRNRLVAAQPVKCGECRHGSRSGTPDSYTIRCTCPSIVLCGAFVEEDFSCSLGRQA